ncbi:Na/Pi symporter [Aquibacillus albus]|uniref:Phosphate:Na+ symporter n=1 Tax=Aquibacillus albus TaxID=1168171 RepID=A0ABS2MUM9_9BACI|nr:Na/Pi symporter [Aquibacillus albus]MBM7569619.1 phosphate:Na+ symporter [Aquibacillus albus]
MNRKSCPYNDIEVNKLGDLISLTAIFIMLFFLGMSILRTGLYQLSYQKMKDVLANLTKSFPVGLLTGCIATVLLQSSSLIMILTISFVSLGYISFKNSIGVIFGANIGTTATGEILAYSDFIPETAILIIGAILLFFPNKVAFSLGAIFVGLGSIFVSLNGFESLATEVARMPILSQSIQYSESNPHIGVIIGLIVSAIIQSSSATIGITMSFLDEGILTIAASIAIVLGANIGTCFTSILATLGTNKEAKLVAMAHVWFNIAGVLLFIPFLDSLSDVAQLLSTNLKEQLAHISVLFNVLSVLIFLPFIHLFQKFIMKIHGQQISIKT